MEKLSKERLQDMTDETRWSEQARVMAREILELRAAVEFLSPTFIAAMNDVGRYGYEKYGEDSLHFKRIRGYTSRGDSKRTTTQAILDHARTHMDDYCLYKAHDHFNTDVHQLAAAAFNCMMEAHFAGMLNTPMPTTGGKKESK